MLTSSSPGTNISFLAADTETPISMATLVVALQQQLRKMGRLISAADFGPYSSLDVLSDGDGVNSEAPTADGRAVAPGGDGAALVGDGSDC